MNLSKIRILISSILWQKWNGNKSLRILRGVNLLDADMRFAVGFEGYLDHQLKNDTRYVKVLARIVGIDSDGAKSRGKLME